MKKNIAVVLQYEGTRYRGWQVQGNTDRTIQGKLEELVSRMAGIRTEVHGSGRTDAGVHALAQTANFRIDTDMTPAQIMDYMNRFLPGDISVISAREEKEGFHSRLSASAKTYRYRIMTGMIPDVFKRRYTYYHPDALDQSGMREGAELFLGRHDFFAFQDNRRLRKSSVRDIYSVSISENENELILDITGNGFLYHMARIMAGTLIERGEGKRQPGTIITAFDSGNRQDAGMLAPPEGLFLKEVIYD